MKKKTIKCNKCGYEWVPKVEKPKACPNCKQYQVKQKKGG
jgi:predicted Zn-ribbon and HTH transcriptional regulator